MLLSFNEAVKEYGNQYQLSQALAQQKVYKIEEGIYSTDKYVSEVVTVMKKYRGIRILFSRTDRYSSGKI